MKRIEDFKEAILALIRVTDDSGGAEARLSFGWKWLPKNWRAGIYVSWDEGYQAGGENLKESPDA